MPNPVQSQASTPSDGGPCAAFAAAQKGASAVQSPRLTTGHVLLVFLCGLALGQFVWEVTQFPVLTAAVLGPGIWGHLPRCSLTPCALLVAVGLMAFWMACARLLTRQDTGRNWHERLRRDAFTYTPAFLLLAVTLPGTEMMAPYLLILAAAGLVALKLHNCGLRIADRGAGQSKIQNRKSEILVHALLWAGIGIYFLAFSAMGILQYYALNVAFGDAGVWDNMMWNTWHGKFLTTESGYLLREHMLFIVLLLLPIYMLVPGMPTLMVVQTAALAAGAIPIFWLAREHLKSDLAALVLALAYLLYPPLQLVNLQATYITFSPISFSIPLLLFGFYFLTKGRLAAFSVCAFLTLLCREEFALTVLALGIYAALELRRRAFGWSCVMVGALWFFLSIWVAIPYFRGSTPHFLDHYSHLGGSATEIARTLTLHPLHAFAASFDSGKIVFLLSLLVPLGLLPLLGLKELALAAPAIAYSLLSNRESQVSTLFHYHTPIVPFAAIAAVYGARNLPWLWARLKRTLQDERAPVVSVATLGLLLACALASNLLLAKSPLSLSFHNPASTQSYAKLYRISDHARLLAEVKPLVPPRASLVASEFIGTHFVHRDDFRRLSADWTESDYVLVDLKERWLNAEKAAEFLDGLVGSGRYETMYSKDGIRLLRRKSTGKGAT